MAGKIGSLFIEISATTAKLQKELKTATGAIQQTQRDLQRIGKQINTIFAVAGIGIAIAGVKRMTDSLADLAEKGERAGSISEAFKQLGGSSASLEEARKATIGLVDSFDLMAIANKAMIAKVPDLNKHLGLIADVGGRLANALGTDTKGAIEGLSEAITKGTNKALKPYGIVIDETANKSERFRQIWEQLTKLQTRTPEVTDSVANAYAALKIQIGETIEKIGIQFNQNEGLRTSLRQLSETIAKIDWAAFANGLAKIAEWAAKAADAILKMGEAVAKSFSSDTDSMSSFKDSLKVVKEFQEELEKIYIDAVGVKTPAQVDALKSRVMQLNEVFSKNKDILKQYEGELATVTQSFGAIGSGGLIGRTKEAKDETGELGSAAIQAAKQLQNLKKEFDRTFSDSTKKGIEESVSDAIKKLDQGAFRDATDKLKGQVRADLDEKFGELVKKGKVTADEFNQLVVNAQVNAVANYEDQMSSAIEENAKKLQDEQQDAFKKSVDFWQNTFENAIKGTTFNLHDILDQIAVGFAAQMAASLTAGIGGPIGQLLGGITSPQGLGGSIFNSILGSAAQSGIGSALGLPTGSSLLSGGLSGGLSGIIGSLGGGAGTLLSNGSIIAAGASVPAGAAAVGSAALPGSGLLGALGGMGPLGWGAMALGGLGLFGGDLFKGGVTHPGSLARKHTIEFLEEKFGRNIVQGEDTRFNNGKGWEFFNSLEDGAKSSFKGIGAALVQLTGNVEGDGAQIGAILSENFKNGADGARELAQELQGVGINADELIGQLLEFGKTSDQTWLEIESDIRGVEEAFKPGLAAMGAFAESFQNIIDSENRGQKALNALRTEAVEAQEAQIKNFQEWQNKLVESGKFSAEQVAIFFQALANYGVTTFDQLANASDRTAAAILANMQAMGFAFKQPEAVATGTAKPAAPGGSLKFAKGGIVGGPSFFMAANGMGLMGEAGPEAILPLDMVGGHLGVRANVGGVSGAPSIVYQIDARGASAGVEGYIQQALRDLEESVVARTMHMVTDSRRRGGAFFDSFSG